MAHCWKEHGSDLRLGEEASVDVASTTQLPPHPHPYCLLTTLLPAGTILRRLIARAFTVTFAINTQPHSTYVPLGDIYSAAKRRSIRINKRYKRIATAPFHKFRYRQPSSTSCGAPAISNAVNATSATLFSAA